MKKRKMDMEFLNYIIETTKERELKGLIFEPTLEECEFLYKKGVTVISGEFNDFIRE